MGAINFIVTKSDGTLHCMICNCDIPSLINMDEHIIGKRHNDSLEQYGGHIVRRGQNHRYFCNCCGCQVLGWCNIYPHLTGRRHTTLMNKIDESLATCKGLPCNFVVRKKDNSHYCCICDCQMSGPKSAEEHIAGYRHEESMKIYSDHVILVKNNYQYCCKLCRCKFYGYYHVHTHINGKRHRGFLNEIRNEE